MIKVKSVFSEKIWGGKKLKDLGFDIPSEKTGEAWIISAYEGNTSLLDNGKNLREFYLKNKHLFNDYPNEEFPLLVKILDAKESLSIQVHPNNEKAKELENYPYGKTECWYILDSEKDTEIIIDISSSSKEEAENLIKNKEWDKLLLKQPIKKNDIFDIKSGTVHAILGGTLVYELQQSSDITYRLYDFDRLDDKGNLRELHINKSLEVINYKSLEYKKRPILIIEKEFIKTYKLIKNNIFSLEKWVLDGKAEISFNKNDKNFLLLTVIEGNVEINGLKLKTYESAIATSDELWDIKLYGKAIILVGNPN